MTTTRLTEYGMQVALRILARRDKRLGQWIREDGPPPLWGRPQGFQTLVRIILEQQVSLSSARAVFGRLKKIRGGLTPVVLVTSGIAELRRLGLTRQKADYCYHLAKSVHEGRLALRSLPDMPDEQVRTVLQLEKGIGPWTADIYLLMAMRRPDVWPTGDLALMISMKHLCKLKHRPTVDEAARQADLWKPWRAVAARVLWQGYLNGRCHRGNGKRKGKGHDTE